MTRAFVALFRREVTRGWPQTRLTLIGASVGSVAAAVVTPSTALVIGICSAMLSLFVPFGPIGDLRTDKMQGFLEFDRVLPVSHATVALARMCGVAVRLLTVLTLALPLALALTRQPDAAAAVGWIVAASAVAAWVLLSAFTWAFIAVNARWNLRRLWWLPMTIAFGPRLLIAVLPEYAKRRIAAAASRFGAVFVHVVELPAGQVVLLLIGLSLPAIALAFAVTLYASALEHYEHDTTINEFVRRPAPRRELGAIGRGPVFAVTRYCIRLATEQMQRRILLGVLFLAAIFFGSAEIKGYAQFYVRTLALMLPGAVVVQLATARALGYLEGFRQLPHPPMVVALGHLFALLLLALPGAGVWVVARMMSGTPPTVTNVATLVALMVTSVWVACVGAVWLTRRRTALLATTAILVIAVWMVYAGRARIGAELQAGITVMHGGGSGASVVLAFALAIAAAMIGLPLFARAIDEYQPSEATARRASRWLGRRRR